MRVRRCQGVRRWISATFGSVVDFAVVRKAQARVLRGPEVADGAFVVDMAWRQIERRGLLGLFSGDRSLRGPVCGWSLLCGHEATRVFLEVREDGEDASVVMGPGWEIELCEDVADVRLDGLGSQPQVLADAPVGQPLGE